MVRMRLRFTKMQGLGNDFVVIDATGKPVSVPPERARAIADRRYGIGCDQILLVEPSPADGIDFGYRIINADGSDVGQCGNGVRCVARFVRDKGLSGKDRLRFATRTAQMEVTLDGEQVRVDMGEPVFAPAALPFVALAPAASYTLDVAGQAVRFGICSMGNPHAVIAVEDVDQAPVHTLGPALEAHAAFPERVNVGFAQVVSGGQLRLRVWERGAGETLACGSGACAAVAVLRQWGRVDAQVEVALPGGSLDITWPGVGQPLVMAGPAVVSFEGETSL